MKLIDKLKKANNINELILKLTEESQRLTWYNERIELLHKSILKRKDDEIAVLKQKLSLFNQKVAEEVKDEMRHIVNDGLAAVTLDKISAMQKDIDLLEQTLINISALCRDTNFNPAILKSGASEEVAGLCEAVFIEVQKKLHNDDGKSNK